MVNRSSNWSQRSHQVGVTTCRFLIRSSWAIAVGLRGGGSGKRSGRPVPGYSWLSPSRRAIDRLALATSGSTVSLRRPASRVIGAVVSLVLAIATTACESMSPTGQTGYVAQTASATAVASLPDPVADEARRFRDRYGLRADDVWIRAVAADPLAQQGIVDYGVPLMPFERLDLEHRRTDIDLLRQINDYGSLFAGSFAGAYVDQRASQAFVASFKDDADRHRAALANLLPAGARVDVRDVNWSKKELEDFVAVVEAEQAWFETIGVQYLTADRGISEDFVSVDFLGPEAAIPVIEEHFGNPTWLEAERQGPLPWTGPRGNLVIVVVDRDGKPVPRLWCEFIPEDPDATDGGEDIFGTGKDGRCSIPNLPAVAYRIVLHRFVDNDHYEPIKRFRVVLAPRGTTHRVVVRTP